MDVAALVISILAFVAAVVSAIYTRSQAESAKATARLEGQRRHDERTPTFEATIEDVNSDGGFYRLWLVLTSSEELGGIEIRLPDGSSFKFAEHVLGVKAFDRAESSTDTVSPRVKDNAWRVEIVGDYRGVEWLTVRARAVQDPEIWTVQVPVEPPYDPLKSIL